MSLYNYFVAHPFGVDHPVEIYEPTIDSLRGTPNSLEAIATVGLVYDTLIEFALSDGSGGLIGQAFSLQFGPANLGDPNNQVAPLDYDSVNNNKHWQRVAFGTAGAGGAVAVIGETPSGTINGSNVNFTTAHPFQFVSTSLYLNGLRQEIPDDYVETSNQILTFVVAPISGDKIRVDYLRL